MFSALIDHGQGSALACFALRAAEARRFRQARGMLCSEKMSRPVMWTSAFQRDAMMLLELQHSVCAYEAWPPAIKLDADGERIEYHPSIGITFQNGRRAVIDIVRSDHQGTTERAAFDVLLSTVLAQDDISLVTMGERALRHDPRLANARAVCAQ